MARSILITGAGGGIGAATARYVASPDARLFLTYASDEDGARRTAADCAEAGASVEIAQLDQGASSSVAALVAAITDRWGELHVLVNNGSTCPRTPWDEITIDEWDTVMEVNARGPFILISGLVPLLRRADGDRAIVNVASIAGQIGGITTSVHYAASKAALLAITRCFARLLAEDRIRVNAVSPGPVETAMQAVLSEDVRGSLGGSIPLKRFGTAEEVAATIALLTSDQAGFTTGATYDVNGGLLMD